MKTGSQSTIFDYNTGEVDTSVARKPTTSLIPPKTVSVPALPWQKHWLDDVEPNYDKLQPTSARQDE